MESYYIAVLNSISRIGSKTIKKLIEFFGSAENVWNADISQFQNIELNQTARDNLFQFRSKNPDAVEKLVDFCNVKNIKICTIYDKDYPPILGEIQNAPVLFYYRGTINPNAERLAVVGSRNATEYGKKVSENLVTGLTKAGITIVSGAANGIDTFAHKAALKFGRTVAVLGYGLNKIPADKSKMLDDIVENGGVVLTEFSPNTNGSNKTFPARNRIIAGLSRGVIVIEAKEKSGSLIAARIAADNSRKVFAVPNSVFSETGAGCLKLIRDGAVCVSNISDILGGIENVKK